MDGQYNQQKNSRKAPNIFQQFVISFVPPQYGRLTKVKTGSMIGFVTLLTLIATASVFFSLVFTYIFRGGRDAFLDWMPNFEIKNGRFSIDEDYMLDNNHQFVYLTDEADQFTQEDVEYMHKIGYSQILLGDRYRVCVMTKGEYREFYYRELGDDFEIDREWAVQNLMNIVWVCIVVGCILFFVGRTLWYFLCAAVYFLIALLIAQITQKKQPAGDLFRVAVYSKVLMFVVAALLDMIPFVSIPMFIIFRIVITITFMSFAIVNLPEKQGCQIQKI